MLRSFGSVRPVISKKETVVVLLSPPGKAGLLNQSGSSCAAPAVVTLKKKLPIISPNL